MVENKQPLAALNDQERFPLLRDLSLLNTMKQDEFAPVFNFQSGDRLSQGHLEKVQRYADKIRGEIKFWKKGTQPDWIRDYFSWCNKTVPFYKNRKGSFEEQATISRGDIGIAPWELVSADSPLEDLLVYSTSGTTGAAMNVLFDPVSQGCWFPQLQSILDRYDISLDGGPDAIAIALICSQSSTLTYASLSTYLEGAGVLKINLHPDDWKDPAHRTQYLEKYNPQVLTGDPFAFMDLLHLKPKINPKVLVSSAMKLTEGIRKKLESHFKCPVLDIYSLTECRMIAVAENHKHRAIRPEIYLEIFDKDRDVLLPYGERGELVVTGGNNPFLPLVRYRTGDFCKLEMENGIPYLIDMEARSPVVFYSKEGEVINNIEISREMTRFPLAGFSLHQTKDLYLTFTGWSDQDLKLEIEQSLRQIFWMDVKMEVAVLKVTSDRSFKTVTYTSDFEIL